MFVVTDIALTALCRALCLLLWRKLEMPLNAKPIKPVMIVLKIPFLFFWLSLNLVILSLSHYLICDVLYYYEPLFAFCKYHVWF